MLYFIEGRGGFFAKLTYQEVVIHMDPIDWWFTYRFKTSELAEIAKHDLSQPMSSSSTKRIWHTYSYIHSVKKKFSQ